MVTGVIQAMHYEPNIKKAFDSIEHITRNINLGWQLRYLHSIGASLFFLIVYLHIGRGYYNNSFRQPRILLWFVGVFIYLFMLATAFLGYVLPSGIDIIYKFELFL